MKPTLNDVINFLLGSGELEGCYFGDIPDGEKPLWWRKHLREAYNASLDTGFLDLRRIRQTVSDYYRLADTRWQMKDDRKALLPRARWLTCSAVP